MTNLNLENSEELQGVLSESVRNILFPLVQQLVKDRTVDLESRLKQVMQQLEESTTIKEEAQSQVAKAEDEQMKLNARVTELETAVQENHARYDHMKAQRLLLASKLRALASSLEVGGCASKSSSASVVHPSSQNQDVFENLPFNMDSSAFAFVVASDFKSDIEKDLVARHEDDSKGSVIPAQAPADGLQQKAAAMIGQNIPDSDTRAGAAASLTDRTTDYQENHYQGIYTVSVPDSMALNTGAGSPPAWTMTGPEKTLLPASPFSVETPSKAIPPLSREVYDRVERRFPRTGFTITEACYLVVRDALVRGRKLVDKGVYRTLVSGEEQKIDLNQYVLKNDNVAFVQGSKYATPNGNVSYNLFLKGHIQDGRHLTLLQTQERIKAHCAMFLDFIEALVHACPCHGRQDYSSVSNDILPLNPLHLRPNLYLPPTLRFEHVWGATAPLFKGDSVSQDSIFPSTVATSNVLVTFKKGTLKVGNQCITGPGKLQYKEGETLPDICPRQSMWMVATKA